MTTTLSKGSRFEAASYRGRRDLRAVVRSLPSVNGGAQVTLATGQSHEVVSVQSLGITSTRPALAGQYLQGIEKTGQAAPDQHRTRSRQALNRCASLLSPRAQMHSPTTCLASPSCGQRGFNVARWEPLGHLFTPLTGTTYCKGHINVPPGAGRIWADAPLCSHACSGSRT